MSRMSIYFTVRMSRIFAVKS